MNKSDFSNFVLALEISCNEIDQNKRDQALNMIYEFKEKNVFGFLMAILEVIKRPEISLSVKNIGLVLSYQVLYNMKIPDSTVSRCAYIENHCSNLLNSLLTASTSLFSITPIHSGNLFACITCIFCQDDANCQIIPLLMQKLDNIDDFAFIEGAFVALDNICSELELPAFCYQPILMKIFTLFGQQNTPDSINMYSMKILSNLINLISDVFQVPQNRQTILTVINFALNNDKYKALGYDCISKIIKFHFSCFIEISSEIIPLSVKDLNDNMDNDEIIFSVGRMIKQLTKVFDENEESLKKKEMLTESFGPYFMQLLKIAASHGRTEPDLPYEFNPHTMAYDLLSRIIIAIPNISIQPSIEFILNNNNSQTAGIREISTTLLAYLIKTSNSNEIIKLSIQIIPEKLTDNAPRVREAALFVLNSAVTTDNFASFRPMISQLIPLLIQMLDDLPIIASNVCVIFPYIVDSNNFPILINALMNYVRTNDASFANFLFDSLSNIFKNHKDFTQIKQVLPQFVELLKQSLVDQTLLHNQICILDMFEKIILKSDELILPYLQALNQYLFSYYELSHNNHVLYCLSALASAAKDNFSPFLPHLMVLILQLSEHPDSNENIFDLVYSLLVIGKYNDLAPYASKCAEVLVNIMKVRENDLVIYNETLQALTMLFHLYFDNTASYVPPCIHLISTPIIKLDEIVDEKERNDFIFAAIHAIVEIFDKAGGSSVQWFELGCRLFEGASQYIDISDEEDADSLTPFVELFEHLSQIHEQYFIQFFSSSESSQKFIAQLMKYDNLSDKIHSILREINIQA